MKSADNEPAAISPLRVVQLTAPARFGGLETVVRQLSRSLVERGHAICVVCLLDEGVDPGEHPFVLGLESDGVSVEVVQLPHRAYLRERDVVAEIVRRFSGGVLHTHGYHADLVGAMASRAAGVPRVATAHGFIGGGWKNRLYEALQRRSYRKVATVVAVSDAIAEDLSRDPAVAPAVRLVPNAWSRRPTRLDRACARELLGLDVDVFTVGWIGRVSPEKGPDVMLDALAEPATDSIVLCMVGDGPLRAELEARPTPPGARVHWTGAVPDVGNLLAAFDAVVLSSRTEGTPMVLLEAVDAEVPVVATRVGGIPATVGPGEAILVDPEDPAALRRAVSMIAADPAGAAERAERAAARLARESSTADWLDQHEAIYSDAVGRYTAGRVR